MTCIASRPARQPKRGKTSFVCIDPDDQCRYFGQLVNDGVHQYEDGECIVCGTPEGGA